MKLLDIMEANELGYEIDWNNTPDSQKKEEIKHNIKCISFDFRGIDTVERMGETYGLSDEEVKEVKQQMVNGAHLLEESVRLQLQALIFN